MHDTCASPARCRERAVREPLDYTRRVHRLLTPTAHRPAPPPPPPPPAAPPGGGPPAPPPPAPAGAPGGATPPRAPGAGGGGKDKGGGEGKGEGKGGGEGRGGGVGGALGLRGLLALEADAERERHAPATRGSGMCRKCPWDESTLGAVAEGDSVAMYWGAHYGWERGFVRRRLATAAERRCTGCAQPSVASLGPKGELAVTAPKRTFTFTVAASRHEPLSAPATHTNGALRRRQRVSKHILTLTAPTPQPGWFFRST
jgi:hypothetical protein